ncbi:MAG TPA: signal peptidase I, partial [Firmicutes bacterium]|nr:signal peptidase I [Bacillota bacterium]
MARRELWSWFKTLILAVILALLIREYVLAFYVVDGSSMLPTLHDGQMVAVNKLVY